MKKNKLNLPTSNSHLGGSILESKKTLGGLKKFSKNKKTKRIVIGSIVGIVLLIGGVTLYKTFALYEEKKEFNVIKGQIPDFSQWTFTYKMNGQNINKPSSSSGYKVTSINCNGATGVTWDNTSWNVKYNINNLTNKNVSCTIVFSNTFSNYLINLSTTDSSLEKMAHESTTQTGTNATTDYRYVGANPNNYVCLESSGTCTEDNLYRIIGVIPTQSTSSGNYENRVKLIKNTKYIENESGYLKAGTDSYAQTKNGYSFCPGSSANNNWAISKINTVVLNDIYWKSIVNYQNYIEEAKFYLGALNGSYTDSKKTPNDFYTAERGSTPAKSAVDSNTISTFVKIGLMYPSDYGFSLGSSHANTTIYNNRALYKSDSWLFTGIPEQTIMGDSKHSYIVNFNVWNNGNLSIFNGGCNNYSQAIRPVFYLKSNVYYGSGSGTKSDPYKLSV